MRSLIEDLAVRQARRYPDQDELPAGMLANIERIDGEIPAGGMRVPLFHDTATDTEHALQVLRADALRWHGFKRALETPDRPTSPTRTSAARSPARSRSKASTTPAGRAEPAGMRHNAELPARVLRARSEHRQAAMRYDVTLNHSSRHEPCGP